jgi:hypothetical protein
VGDVSLLSATDPGGDVSRAGAAWSVRWVDEHPRMPLWRLPNDYVEDPTEVALALRDQHSAALGDLRQWRSRRRERLSARNRPPADQPRRARPRQRTR